MTAVSRRKRFTESDCDFLERSGLLSGKYELIDGDILNRMPQGDRHSLVVIRLLLWLASVFPAELLRTQATIRLDAANRPEPDGFVLAAPLPHDRNYPESADVRFVIEVSDTTLSEDSGIKAQVYAQSGIPEYWIIDIINRRLVAHRLPTPQGYDEVFACAENDSLSPLARPESAVLVSSLLPPELVA